MSLPVRERGLKLVGSIYDQIEELSLPVRERGLKYVADISSKRRTGRSPCGSVD